MYGAGVARRARPASHALADCDLDVAAGADFLATAAGVP